MWPLYDNCQLLTATATMDDGHDRCGDQLQSVIDRRLSNCEHLHFTIHNIDLTKSVACIGLAMVRIILSYPEITNVLKPLIKPVIEHI